MKVSFALAAGLVLAAPLTCIVQDEIKIHKLEQADPVGRPLKPPEIAMAWQIFGDTVDYSKVRVHMTPYFGDPSVTIGNDIYMETPSLHSDDYSRAPPSVQADLDHEIEHVQQKQNNGILKDFFLAVKMARGYIAYKLFGDFSVYEYQLSENTDFAKLNSEQQATMVQDYKLVRERFQAACAPDRLSPVCSDLTPKIKLYERKIGEALPIPGALTFKPG